MPTRIDLPKAVFEIALRCAGGHVGVAAKALGVSVTTLRRRLKEDSTVYRPVGVQEILPLSVLDAPRRYDTEPYEHWSPDGVELEPRVLSAEETKALTKKVSLAISAAQAE
jgi:hypothetical protein